MKRPAKQIRLAMLGMVDEDWHPWSWSAIINGYDRAAMAKCPAPVIPAYLKGRPVGIPAARVTHIWTEDAGETRRIARAALIPNVVKRPEDVFGQVDAVVIPTDIGHEHVARCRPFVEAGLPIFVDKPLVDNAPDLRTFCRWVERGTMILSSSCMRYCKEFAPYRTSTRRLGTLRYATITTPKSWERYGIHALEGAYPILGPGFISARNTGTAKRNVVHFKHRNGCDLVVVASEDMYGGLGVLQLCGTKGFVQVAAADRFAMFKSQLEAFVTYVRTGRRPFPFAETVELMKMVIAGIRSREQGGREIRL